MATFFPVSLFLYLIILFVVYRNESLNFNNPFHVLLLYNGFCDISMLIYSLYSILIDVAQKRVFGLWIDSLVSYLFYWALGWYGTQIFAALIASNRFFALVLYDRYALFTVGQARRLAWAGILLSLMIPLPILIDTGIEYISLFKVGVCLLVILSWYPRYFYTYFSLYRSRLTSKRLIIFYRCRSILILGHWN